MLLFTTTFFHALLPCHSGCAPTLWDSVVFPLLRLKTHHPHTPLHTIGAMAGHGRTVQAAALWLAALCLLHSLHEAHAQGARSTYKSGKDGDTYTETQTESLGEGLETACASMSTWHTPACPAFFCRAVLRAHLTTRPRCTRPHGLSAPLRTRALAECPRHALAASRV